MASPRDPDIDARVARLERLTGKQIVLRPVRPGCQCFRGRLHEKGHCFIIEYRDDTPGYFWHHDIIRELLDCIEEGRGQKITLYDGDVQYVEVPVQAVHKRNRPPRKPSNP